METNFLMQLHLFKCFRLLLLLLTGLFVPACQKYQHSLPEELDPFVDKFIEEAGKRGRDLSQIKEGLIIQYEDLPDKSGGKCTRSFFFPNRISIDKFFWQQMNDRQKELLLFHELGHCVLNRDHRNERLSQGECTSLMDGNEEGFFCSNNFYSKKWRDYYLDELFDESTGIPEWYVVRNLAEVEILDTLLNVSDSLLFTFKAREWHGISRFMKHDSLSDYLIEMTYFRNQRDTSIFSKEYGHFFMATFSEYEIAVLEGNEHSIGFSSRIDFQKDYYYRSAVGSMVEFPLKFSLLVQGGWLTFFINGDQKHIFEENHYRVDPELSMRQKGKIFSIIAPAPNAHLMVYEVK